MPDAALQNALRRQAEISAALAKMSADLAEVTGFIQSYHKMCSFGSLGDNPTEALKPAEPRATAAEHARVLPTKEEVMESVKVARTVIGTRNAPVGLETLYSEARARGFHINTSRPTLTYSARLRDRKNRLGLVFLRGFGWWLSERPYPPANYTPTTTAKAGAHVN